MAKNAIVKISARAKQIRKAHPSMAWKAAIKKASAEYRAGTLGSAPVKKAAAKKKFRQTGKSSKKRDVQRHAKPPGKRIVRHKGRKSTTYTERRKNRSDVPGHLTGTVGNATAYQQMILSRIRQNTMAKGSAEKKIEYYRAKMKLVKGVERTAYKNLIALEKKNIAALRKDTSMLKRLLK